jgi:hypothetical protein
VRGVAASDCPRDGEKRKKKISKAEDKVSEKKRVCASINANAPRTPAPPPRAARRRQDAHTNEETRTSPSSQSTAPASTHSRSCIT